MGLEAFAPEGLAEEQTSRARMEGNRPMTIARMSWIGALLIGLAAADCAQPLLGAAGEAWPVTKKLIGEDGGKSKDVSGIACTIAQGFPRSCLVIDDNLQDAQFVKVTDGEIVAGMSVKLIDNKFDGKPLELDGEGVAFAKERFYVIGSHGHPRDKHGKLDPKKNHDEIQARILASSQVVRFRTTGEDGNASEIERTPRLKEIIAAEPALVPFMDQRLEKNGLTIEGIAIKDDRRCLRIRGPVLTATAPSSCRSIDVLFGGSGRPPPLPPPVGSLSWRARPCKVRRRRPDSRRPCRRRSRRIRDLRVGRGKRKGPAASRSVILRSRAKAGRTAAFGQEYFRTARPHPV
jgi:hypothetical protein